MILKKSFLKSIFLISLWGFFGCGELPNRPLLAIEKNIINKNSPPSVSSPENVPPSNKSDSSPEQSKIKVIVKGNVYNIKSRKPIQGVKITFGDKTAFTDKEGFFSIPDFPVGTYPVTASAEGYTFYKSDIEVREDYGSTSFYLQPSV